MARTALTVQALTGPFPAALTLDTLVWTAADISNLNSFVLTGREIILVRNDDASGQLVTLTSVADDKNRVGNVTKTVATTAYAVFAATDISGWIQSDGLFYLDAPDADVFFSIIRF